MTTLNNNNATRSEDCSYSESSSSDDPRRTIPAFQNRLPPRVTSLAVYDPLQDVTFIRQAVMLELHHLLIALCLNEKYTESDIPERAGIGPFDFLDVGSGTGRWVCEMGKACPGARVFGIGLEVEFMRRKQYLMPPNVFFEDPHPDRLFGNRMYDFIYIRDLLGFEHFDWETRLGSAFAHLRPEGQLEFVQFAFDPSQRYEVPDEAKREEPCRALREIPISQVVAFDLNRKVKYFLDEIGASEVKWRIELVPLASRGDWKQTRLRRDAKSPIAAEIIEHMLHRMMSNKNVLLESSKKLKDPANKHFIKFCVITAKKPA
ncbi:hypothetical protein QQS21_009642 [Conoideocrella luteorostrata]|uniref:Methyltransferase domain-containing protein n=1 Tax=Conoideocrella luteorostrata TaxID=1105319 RepID=A0AAJ0CGW0_9HYPO|nr:hypothetical protein QQS21_009642 [Conoideocrella luteorostrata]